MSVCVHCLMHDDWSFSTPLRAFSACIAAVKWALARKDLHGRRVGERVEEFSPKHERRCVGIYSKRISHLIKTSAQLPGGLCYIKRLHVKVGGSCSTSENHCTHTKNGKQVLFVFLARKK